MREGAYNLAYDLSKLKGRIVEKFKTQINFSKAMNWSERTTSLKLTGKIFWSQEEISKACNVLDIESEEIMSYFFEEKVHKM